MVVFVTTPLLTTTTLTTTNTSLTYVFLNTYSDTYSHWTQGTVFVVVDARTPDFTRRVEVLSGD